MKLFICFFFLTISKVSFGQYDQYISGQIVDDKKRGIPYSTIFSNGFYGCISDTMGYFKIWANPKDTILITSIGYINFKSKAEKCFQNNLFVLKEKSILLDSLVVFPPDYQRITIEISKKIRPMEYVFNHNFEEGVLIYNNKLENKYLESINVILGFNGNPVIPYRINVYSINKEGVPDNLLNRKMVEVFPSKKMKNYKIDFKDQKIKLPENGFCVSIELLNNSIKHKKLGKYYSPIIGFDKKSKNIRIIRTDYLPNWAKFKPGNISLAFGIEVIDE